MDALSKAVLYGEAVKVFGKDAQILVAIEELNECAAALSRFMNGKTDEAGVVTELADAEIMIEQMRRFFGDEAVDYEKEVKLKRLLDRFALRNAKKI